jgi:hypothetical protein
LSKIVSLFVARLSVFISIQRGFEKKGSRQEKKQTAGSFVLDPLLSPLTAKTGAPKKGVKAPPFKWTPEMIKAFDEMKTLMTAEVMCLP